MNRLRPLSVGALMRACPAIALALATACADSPSVPVQPVPAGETPASAVRLLCTGDVATRTVRCDAPGAAAGGPRADRIYGQGTGMKVTSSNIAIVADSFTFDLTVTNNLEYPVGTTDGVNPDPNGIRVFVVDGIHTTQGTGNVTVANADGVDVFTAAGQAYFAYHGVLQPAATTAPRKWKLRFDPGVEQFSFGLYISTPVPPGGGTVTVKITSPTVGQVFADSVTVFAQVTSAPASIQSVTAYVADRSVRLVPGGEGLSGKISLAGLFGPYQLRVHAVTVRADTGNAFVNIIKDAPPTLTVTAPRVDYVAAPNLRIDADCVDDDPAGCASIIVRANGNPIASGTGGVHTDVSLASVNETYADIYFQARDSRNRLVTAGVYVYAQGGPAVPVDSGGLRALDVDSSRFLWADNAENVWVHDRTGDTRTLIHQSNRGNLTGFLHPLGAIFWRKANGRIYDWRNGAVVDVGVGGTGLLAEGSWAVWTTTSGGWGLRDLLNGTSVGLINGVDPDVGPNGDVVYVNQGTYRYRGGAAALVDSFGTEPVTDGINVVYRSAGSVKAWNGSTHLVLTTQPAAGAATPLAHNYYEAAGGWIAYAVLDGGGASQLRVRTPGGTDTQVTSFLTSSVIRGLSTEGTLVYANNGALYVLRAPYTGTPLRIGKDWFTVRFRGTRLYLLLGNTALSVSY